MISVFSIHPLSFSILFLTSSIVFLSTLTFYFPFSSVMIQHWQSFHSTSSNQGLLLPGYVLLHVMWLLLLGYVFLHVMRLLLRGYVPLHVMPLTLICILMCSMFAIQKTSEKESIENCSKRKKQPLLTTLNIQN
jgi:glucan phosphoethanolaminetransferase (alkaline phosphatase superfamily)